MRLDEPGWIHHVYNRGVGHRVVFEDLDAVRVFGGLVGREVRARQIEVLSYCFLATHFHLGLISLEGQLSNVMARIESCFVRWFNRRHQRDGPLFRGRFGSRRVKDEAHLATLIRYIDANPVAAGIVQFPEEFPHGSASALLRGPTPPWLSRHWFDRELEDLIVQGMTWERAYRYRFGGLQADEIFLVEQRMRTKPAPDGELEDLIGSAPDSVRQWFGERAELADGGMVGAPVVGPCAVETVLAGPRDRDPTQKIRLGKKRGSPMWPLVEAALLRHFCAMSFAQIAERAGCSTATANRRYHMHQLASQRFADYQSRFVEIATQLLKR